MPRQKLIEPRSESGLTRMTIRVWEEDLEYFKRHFPDNYNAQIRRIIGQWVQEHSDAKQKS